ncbi:MULTISPECIES: ribokinase [Cyanophyceae]|uniref:ribokinase n=1 Tax=Cyanophyceae TaxID=3028117 RepID=UPI00232C594E|nr:MULTISPECIES: ribokinase [Cyanophyceae]MDB9322276.1 ribokinase [Nodularia spumigena CS-591/07A]MDB9329306.1 ribokinase [Nodularia spumigena CS-591/04]MDB9340563.1 ribokinase [Nodularia spumigena CS-589/07]MDB9343118.1 ribokinase [Nodularia spumigena CS-588/06]MDB9358850.1 ribokinase [Nodularia spumigena CS-588/02]
MTIIVFGSINIDLVATTSRLPIAGETILGEDFFKIPGGKGANQAVALARLEIPTHMVGRVGAQSFGEELVHNLQLSGVQTENIFIDETVNSGVAIITVDNTGENQIVVIPGANGRVNSEDIKRLSQLLPTASALLLQLEIPIDAVVAAAKAAKNANIQVILDPAPAQGNLPDELYLLVDIITPNEVEAGQLVGFSVDNEESAIKAAKVLLERGVKCAIVKLGAKGAVCATAEETFFVPAFPVHAVDTVAAGDAFNGGLAAALYRGLSLHQAIIWGSAAGALAATKIGAQTSLPDKLTFDYFLAEKEL